jgi:hypothetical protein
MKYVEKLPNKEYTHWVTDKFVLTSGFELFVTEDYPRSKELIETCKTLEELYLQASQEESDIYAYQVGEDCDTHVMHVWDGLAASWKRIKEKFEEED